MQEAVAAMRNPCNSALRALHFASFAVDSSIMAQLRQQVLVLYLANSALDSHVKGWSIYDGTGQTRPTTGDSDVQPYFTGLDALMDGWRVIQFPQLLPPYPNLEYTTSFQMYEFIFEKLVETSA